MKNILHLCIPVALTLLCCKEPVAQTPPSPGFAFVDSFFTDHSFRFEERDLYFPPDYTEIGSKFQAAINKDLTWYKQYTKKHGEFGENFPYHEKLGITRQEFERYKLLSKNSDSLQLRSKGIRSIGIIRQDKIIHFKDTGTDNRLNDVYIDLARQLITVHGDTLGKPEEITMKENNAYGVWQGYGWQWEQMKPSEKKPGSLTGMRIYFTVGKTDRQEGLLMLYYLRLVDGAYAERVDIKGFVLH